MTLAMLTAGGHHQPQVAIIDYGTGNLASAAVACEATGLSPRITRDPGEVLAADAVLLPGVGAFAEAMESLSAQGLIPALREAAAEGTPILGVCLGMQLLFSEGCEHGRRAGLGLIPGTVERIPTGGSGARVKVPHVGWGRLRLRADGDESPHLRGIEDGTYMYFVHSYVVRPEESACVVATTDYGGAEFCSAVRQGGMFGCQFHPERSGPAGLRVYGNLASLLANTRRTSEAVRC